MFRDFRNRLRLNLRAIRLAVSGEWLRPDDLAKSYDMLAPTYDERWLRHLYQTTDRLHERLSAALPEGAAIFELGCGSGYSTAYLRNQYSDSPFFAVDISPNMIELARSKITASGRTVEFRRGEMLDFLRERRNNEAGLVFSGWAIGYSHPASIIAEAARVLRPGGTLAVVVNRLETLPAVFRVFRRTMRRFPGSLSKALWPRFPKNRTSLSRELIRNRFRIDSLEEGGTPIEPPPDKRLDWLLGTGVLAGFDAVLPLRESGEVRDFFAAELDRTETGWEHYYIMLTAAKKPCR